MIEDGDATRTGVAETADAPAPPARDDHVVAPLQYRNPHRYELLGEHGRGGIGRVQRAHDKELGRSVAIKELIKRGDLGEVRFLREAMITARLEHPGIVPIHEAGRWPDGTPFYVMKLVAGRSLKELIDERRTIDERLGLLHHVIAVADAVAYAHERGIIHRDLKPGNVIAGDFGETIVIDWGLAKDLRAAQDEPMSEGPFRTSAPSDLTAAGSVLGTPMYMSPEQARGARVDERTDVYAIGAMLWQLCSLMVVPPSGARARERMLRRSRIDRDLITIICKTLANKPADRYRNAGELAADLKAFKSGAKIAARHYSLLATLAHWIRRHRVIATTIVSAATLVVLSSVLYVRSIANERDRADEAAARAETERAIAASERDHARLAEASALLAKDPTRALQVLDTLSLHTPQYALLRSRAIHGAASRVIRVPAGISTVLLHPETRQNAVVTTSRELVFLDLETGEQGVIDRNLTNALAPATGGWVYARKAFKDHSAVLATTGTSETIDVGTLLGGDDSTLVVSSGRTYALDRDVLYVVDANGPAAVRRGVHAIAGSDRVLMICTSNGVLEILRDGAVDRRTRCANKPGARPMTAAGLDYAALLDPETVLLVRGDKALSLATRVTSEPKLALSGTGVLAMADLDGKPWFVPRNGESFQLGPLHPARVLGVAVDGHIAAWSFEDGAVIAQDTTSGQTWQFIGHSAPVVKLTVDARNARVVSTARDELRVWALRPSPLELVDRLPCLAFNAALSPDSQRVALDCNDGTMREWTLEGDALRALHRHDGLAYGVAWLGDEACSAGWDGRVLCSNGAVTREVRSRGSRVRRVAATSTGDELAIASDDGAITTSAGTELYRHTSSNPYVVAFSSDGQRVASGAFDGSLIVYDTSEQRIVSTTTGHLGLVTSAAWRERELWTAGMDGAIKRWQEVAGTLEPIETIRERGAVRCLRLFPDGWSGTIGGRTLVVSRSSRSLRLDLDLHIERCDVSPDHRYIAAGTANDVVVLDLDRRAVAMLPVASRGGYVGFAKPGALTISTASRLVAVPLSSLEYIPYNSTVEHNTQGRLR